MICINGVLCASDLIAIFNKSNFLNGAVTSAKLLIADKTFSASSHKSNAIRNESRRLVTKFGLVWGSKICFLLHED